MAGPINPAVNQAVQQVAQQQQQAKPDVQKSGASKFDQTMANKTEMAQQTGQVNKTQAAQQAQAVQKADHANAVNKSGKVDQMKTANAVKKNDPVDANKGAQKASDKKGGGLEDLLTKMEDRHSSMDKFIKQCMNGKVKMNQQQLLGLQAKVSEYSLELDLTGKVVEKATNGMKETLRTQV